MPDVDAALAGEIGADAAAVFVAGGIEDGGGEVVQGVVPGSVPIKGDDSPVENENFPGLPNVASGGGVDDFGGVATEFPLDDGLLDVGEEGNVVGGDGEARVAEALGGVVEVHPPIKGIGGDVDGEFALAKGGVGLLGEGAGEAVVEEKTEFRRVGLGFEPFADEVSPAEGAEGDVVEGGEIRGAAEVVGEGVDVFALAKVEGGRNPAMPADSDHPRLEFFEDLPVVPDGIGAGSGDGAIGSGGSAGVVFAEDENFVVEHLLVVGGGDSFDEGVLFAAVGIFEVFPNEFLVVAAIGAGDVAFLLGAGEVFVVKNAALFGYPFGVSAVVDFVAGGDFRGGELQELGFVGAGESGAAVASGGGAVDDGVAFHFVTDKP